MGAELGSRLWIWIVGLGGAGVQFFVRFARFSGLMFRQTHTSRCLVVFTNL